MVKKYIPRQKLSYTLEVQDYIEGDVTFVESASDNDLLSVLMLTNACIEE